MEWEIDEAGGLTIYDYWEAEAVGVALTTESVLRKRRQCRAIIMYSKRPVRRAEADTS